jgi:flagellar assembly protein FliH
MSLSKLSWNLKSEAVVKDFQLPDFAMEPATKHPSIDYTFTPFGENNEDVTMTLAEAEQQAETMRRQSQEEAEAVLKTAREESDRLLKEAEEIHRQAEEKGYAQGLEEGRLKGEELGRSEFETNVRPALNALHQVEDLYQDLWTVNEAGLVKLALKVAERIVMTEMSYNPEIISAAFKAAVAFINEQHQAVFRVNPEDVSHLEKLRNESRDLFKGLVKVTFQPDPNLPRGDIVMETDAGRVDATLQKRINSVVSEVDAVLEEHFGLDW